MANIYKIPFEIECFIRKRDIFCVYCGVKMQNYSESKIRPTIEHIDNDQPWIWGEGLKLENIVICCGGCNSSKGAKSLLSWFESAYCIARGISAATVAEPIRRHLERISREVAA